MTHSRSRFIRVSAFFALALAGTATLAVAQQGSATPHGNHPRRGGLRSHLIELPTLVKTCSFPVSTLPRPLFMMMACETANVPAGFLYKNSPPAQLVEIEYSHTGTHGGIIRLYEVGSVAGVSPDVLIRKVANAGIFRDVPHDKDGWQIKPLVVKGAVVGPSSVNVDAMNDAVRSLGR